MLYVTPSFYRLQTTKLKEETSKSDDKITNKEENSGTNSQENKETNTPESSPVVPEQQINSGNTVPFNKNKELENIIANAANSCVYKGMSERDAVIAINNYVCNLITYDESYGDAYTAFTTGRGRCASYAACVKAMYDYVGVECKEIEGKADRINGWGLHAWNRVKIGGTWYYIDACWNDSTNNEYMFSTTLWNNHKI